MNFRKQYIKNGGKVADLSYKTPWYPIVPWLVIILCLISMIGIAFDPSQRIGLIIGVIFCGVCYGTHELFLKKKFNYSEDERSDIHV